MRRLISVVALTVALALGAAACSGDDASSSSDRSTAAGSATTAAGGDAGATGGGDFCDESRDQLAKVFSGGRDQLLGTVLPGLLDPSKAEAARSQLKALAADVRASNEAVVDAAPAEIRADLETVLSAVTALYDALEKADYDVTKIDIGALSSVPSDPNLQGAAERVGAYYKDRCGIDLDSLGS
jgi:hypothetical protein